ncbi:MAG: hypothetical protein M3370_05605 [Actinomycetota bacterium]|nr:hypothetical protein [Actinomycetota bacterium]
MRGPEEVAAVEALGAEGHNASQIASITGLPRSTVRDWLTRPALDRRRSSNGPRCQTCGGSHGTEALPVSYVYLLGLYLGDGCISAHRRGVYRLRIFLDLRYPGIVSACVAAIQDLTPGNRVGMQDQYSHYVERDKPSNVQVSAYSKTWPCLFPQHGRGRKHERPIALTPWQRELVERDPRGLLSGLIHSDGCRFMNTGRNWRSPRYSFRNRSDDIRAIFCAACDLLGVRWTTAPHTVYVSRKADVARLDEFIGPKA